MKLPWSKKNRDAEGDELHSQVLRQIVASRNSNNQNQAVPEYTLADFISIGNRDVGIGAKAAPPEPPVEVVSPEAALRAIVTEEPVAKAEPLDEEALRQLSLEELVGLLESDEPPPPIDKRFSA